MKLFLLHLVNDFKRNLWNTKQLEACQGSLMTHLQKIREPTTIIRKVVIFSLKSDHEELAERDVRDHVLILVLAYIAKQELYSLGSEIRWAIYENCRVKEK